MTEETTPEVVTEEAATETKDPFAALTEDLQRLQAEFANYRKRVDRDRALAGEIAISAVLLEFLAVLDDLDRAEAHNQLSGGFKAVADQIITTTSKLGLEKYGDAPATFDPNIHDALMHETSEEVKETTNELYIIFALGLLTAYLVMAATFNSFVHPFIIMLTVPLAVFGGLVFILFLNSSINIFSQIALVILIGISTKNSILIVDYANQIRTTGKDLVSSVKEASSLRFRPIMMTSISTMIAMMPLVIGNIGPGAGEASRLAVGATILGGMIISTFFTLYVTPTMYLALARNSKRIDSVDLELKRELSKK